MGRVLRLEDLAASALHFGQTHLSSAVIMKNLLGLPDVAFSDSSRTDRKYTTIPFTD